MRVLWKGAPSALVASAFVAAATAWGQGPPAGCMAELPFHSLPESVRDAALSSTDSARATVDLTDCSSAHTRPAIAGSPTVSRRLVRATAGVVIGASVAHLSNAPTVWTRSADGAARRLADQSGFVAIRSLSHAVIRGALSWEPTAEPCPSGVLARSRCAITQTLVVHNAAGDARPDVARIGSLAIASLGSLLWRPERSTSHAAGTYMLSRVGSGLAFAALRRGLASRRKPTPN